MSESKPDFEFDELPPEPEQDASREAKRMKMHPKAVSVDSLPPDLKTFLKEEEEEAEEEVNEIDLRMAKAQYYWEIMGLDPFEDPDMASDEVWAEVQNFCRERLAELMGMKKLPKKGKKRGAVPALPVLKTTLRKPFKNLTKLRAKDRDASKKASTPTPTTATSTEDSVEIETPLVGGGVKRKLYRRFIDKESTKEYWLGYDWSGSQWTGDGNKYFKSVNQAGTEYFRVLSQQTLPPGVTINVPLTSAQIEAQSYAHASQTMRALKKSNPLIANAVELSLK